MFEIIIIIVVVVFCFVLLCMYFWFSQFLTHKQLFYFLHINMYSKLEKYKTRIYFILL